MSATPSTSFNSKVAAKTSKVSSTAPSISQPAKDERGIPVAFDNRNYDTVMRDLYLSANDYLTKNYLRHEKALYEESSKKLDEGRQRWEEEIKVMRDQFFSLAPHQLQKERAAALMDTYTFDQLHTHNVRAGNGQLYFQLRFAVGEFDLSKLRVGVKGSRLTIRAVQASTEPHRARELLRGINLPSNAILDDSKMTAAVTTDSILVVMVPLKSTGPGGEHKCVPPTMSSSMESPQVMRNGTDRMVRLQVFLGKYYKPNEISVLVGEHSVKVYAKHEDKMASSSCFREFQREWDLPEEVLSTMACASLTPAGTLVVEAPMTEKLQSISSSTSSVTNSDVTTVNVTMTSDDLVDSNGDIPNM